MLLGGKCRHCRVKISPRYPIVEFLTGTILVLFFLKFGVEKIYFFYIIIVGYLIVLTFIDIDKKEVPYEIIIVLFITGLMLSVLEIKDINIFNGIIAAITGGFSILILNFFSNGKIGEGDIKLIMCLGLCLGTRDIIGIILYAFIIGGIVSVVLLIAGKYKRADEVAFVPFITAAFLVQSLIF